MLLRLWGSEVCSRDFDVFQKGHLTGIVERWYHDHFGTAEGEKGIAQGLSGIM